MLKQKRDPDILIEEPCAITTRVAPSFLRVGHIDLFSRRATADNAGDLQREELEKIVNHALFREYPDLLEQQPTMEGRAEALLEAFGDRLASLVGGWLRVGFCQVLVCSTPGWIFVHAPLPLVTSLSFNLSRAATTAFTALGCLAPIGQLQCRQLLGWWADNGLWAFRIHGRV